MSLCSRVIHFKAQGPKVDELHETKRQPAAELKSSGLVVVGSRLVSSEPLWNCKLPKICSLVTDLTFLVVVATRMVEN